MICKPDFDNLQQVCSSQFAASLPFAVCSKSAVRRGGSRKIFDRIKSAVELCNVRDPSAERASPPGGPKKF